MRVNRPGAQRRQDSEQNSGCSGHTESKSKNPDVDVRVSQPRNVEISRQHGDQQPRTSGHEKEPGRTAGERQQDAFGQQLPHQPRGSRPQGNSDGDFALPRCTASEHDAGDVGTGDKSTNVTTPTIPLNRDSARS